MFNRHTDKLGVALCVLRRFLVLPVVIWKLFFYYGGRLLDEEVFGSAVPAALQVTQTFSCMCYQAEPNIEQKSKELNAAGHLGC